MRQSTMWTCLLLSGFALIAPSPARAVHPNVGNNLDDFTVLAGDAAISTGGTVTVDGSGLGGSVAGSPGRVGAVTAISPTFVASGGLIVGGITITAANEVDALQAALFAYTPTTGLDFTGAGTVSLDTLNVGLGAGILGPGVYRFDAVTIAPGATVTFSGTGAPAEFLLNISGGMTTGASSQTALAAGAHAADIFWNVGTTANLDGDLLHGVVLTGGDVDITGGGVGEPTTYIGKLMSANDDIVVTGNVHVVDSGLPPDTQVNGVEVPQAGTQLLACVGETLNFAAAANDPDGGGSADGDFVLTRTSVAPPLALLLFAGPTSATGLSSAVLNESFTPTAPFANTVVVATYRASDQSGALGDFTADIFAAPAGASIAGLLFNDFDEDGVQDPGEPGFPGVTVNLDAGADSTVDATDVTDGTGAYAFTGLAAGTYRVRIVTPPIFVQTSANPADVVLGGCDAVADVDFGISAVDEIPTLGHWGLAALVLLFAAAALRRLRSRSVRSETAG